MGAPVAAIGFKHEGGHIPQTLVPEDMGCNIKGLTKKRPLFQPFKHGHHNADNLTLVSNGDLLRWRLTMLPEITDRSTYLPNVESFLIILTYATLPLTILLKCEMMFRAHVGVF